MNGQPTSSGPQRKTQTSGSRLRTLLHELDSSDDDELPSNALGSSATPNDATPAWLKEFNVYINTTDEIPEGQTIIQWWGVSYMSHTHCECYSPVLNRSMATDTPFGHLLLGITSQLWHHQCRASELSLLQVLQFRSAKTASKGISSKHCSV